jgi:hypothetical protein
LLSFEFHGCIPAQNHDGTKANPSATGIPWSIFRLYGRGRRALPDSTRLLI